MQHLGEQKADANLVDAVGYLVGRELDSYSQRFGDVDAATEAGYGPVAVFSDTQSCAGDHQCGSCRHVETAAYIPARSTGIYQGLSAGPGDYRRGRRSWLNGVGLSSHYARKASQLVDGFPLHSHGGQQRGDLGIGTLAAHYLLQH